MNIEELNKLFDEAEIKGFVELSKGVYLNSRENILADQTQWDEEDLCKTKDFSKFKYWITTDSGNEPVGIDTPEQLFEHVDCANNG